MSDPRDESSPEEDAVSDLLGSLRDPGPVPTEVARRLEERLADLVAERESDPVFGTESGPVFDTVPGTVSMTRRPRRRVLGGVLAVAAAVVVGGVAITQVPGIGPTITSDGSDTASSGVESGAESPTAGGEDGFQGRASEGLEDDGGPDTSPDDAGPDTSEPGQAVSGGQDPGEEPTVSSDSLRRDLIAVRDSGVSGTSESALPCRPPASPRAPGVRVVAVQWDGLPALVLIEPAGADGEDTGGQKVHLHPCTRGRAALRKLIPAS